MMMEKGKGEKKSRGKEEARQKWGKGQNERTEKIGLTIVEVVLDGSGS